jgi:hypothetical protein
MHRWYTSYAKIALYDPHQMGYNGPMMREDINMRNSMNYRDTVYDLNDSIIDTLKNEVKTRNYFEKLADLENSNKFGYTTRYRLRARGRLGLNNRFAHLYAIGGKLHRYSSQDIRPEHAQRFDVYIERYRKYSY